MAAQLTRNFIEALYKNDYSHFENPVVQVLNIKTTQSNAYRVLISDGIYFMSCLTSSLLMEQTSHIKKNSLIKIKKCISNKIHTKNWTICAKAINKSKIRYWSNSRGEGKLFSVVFMDDSSEIKATAFNESCDYLYEKIEQGKIYQISGAIIKLANKRYNNCNNDYEMEMNLKTTITINKNHTFDPKMHYSFVPLNQLMNYEKDSVIDVIGVVDEVNEISESTSKATNIPIQRRDIYIVDDTEYKVRVTLWNKHAKEINFETKSVVAFKTIRVSDFGGRTLSVLSSTIITLNPDINESHRITGWYSRYGDTVDFKHYSGLGSYNSNINGMNGYKTIQQISDENLGSSETSDYFNIIGTISYIKKENFAYPACPNDGCSRKVIEEEDSWRCERCCQSYPKPNYKYILNVNILDHTGNQYVTFFNDIAEKLIGFKAQRLMEIKETEINEFNSILDKITLQKYDFRIRAKTESFNDKPIFRCFAVKVKPVNYKLQIKNNINSINKLMNELKF
ncbi:replication factor-a protein [Neocallimastix californiae]|uniref:Replication protein A subunit n=1 Tax=Neocallimastix californiae TaxID=1754190 RepID=A0A1Y2F6Y0_9FUNG|nr:replication factor-a protein [Neocallimastix californiae]|eukprot:ORY79652.1 replication factor-a protein [Neocallimastix californiae]